MDPRVLDTMLPYFTDQYGNPHSRTHAYGWEAEKAVEEARKVCWLSRTGLLRAAALTVRVSERCGPNRR